MNERKRKMERRQSTGRLGRPKKSNNGHNHKRRGFGVYQTVTWRSFWIDFLVNVAVNPFKSKIEFLFSHIYYRYLGILYSVFQLGV